MKEERLELTPIQALEVARRISHSSGLDQLHRVRDVVETINEVLAGDPFGTVRYSEDLNQFYRRVNTSGGPSWDVYGRVGKLVSEIDLPDAAVVYRPGGDT